VPLRDAPRKRRAVSLAPAASGLETSASVRPLLEATVRRLDALERSRRGITEEERRRRERYPLILRRAETSG
jgi:hypothetical protein